jgi:molybdate transport system substrate-binding protein
MSVNDYARRMIPMSTRAKGRTLSIAAVALAAASLLAPDANATTSRTRIAKLTGTISVSAASSLTAAFTDIASEFRRINPKVRVTLNFAGSSTLVTQIRNGAPADVIATADTKSMDSLASANVLNGPVSTFAENRLIIVVPKGNPAKIVSLSDLARDGATVVLGAEGVPVGDYARAVLHQANVSVQPKSLEANVAAIVTKAALREVDAGVVYVTDVMPDDDRVEGVIIPESQNIIARYPIAALRGSPNPRAAKAFVAFTKSTTAQKILARYRFLPPS